MRVQLINITNNPVETIYKAYRICYSKFPYNEVKIPKLDNGEPDMQKMIDFIVPLMMEQHTSPLEHVSFTFSVEGISRACLSQITRHRTFKFNVQSQRYVDGNNFDFVLPNLDYIENEADRNVLEFVYQKNFEHQKDLYNLLISQGVKKEDARAILPQATTCNLVVTMDLNNFRNFLRQRLCRHAQGEIRLLAQAMVSDLKPYIPFVDHKVLLCQQGLCDNCQKNSHTF